MNIQLMDLNELMSMAVWWDTNIQYPKKAFNK